MSSKTPSRAGDSETAAPPAAPPGEAPGYAVGPNRPPLETRWRKGVSGNPMGRPRRPAMAAPGGRRLIPAEPTELELAVAEPVMCLMVDASEPVSRPRAVVARLTEQALSRGDVAACRELLRLCAEVEAVGVERAVLAAEQAEAEADAARAAEDAEAARARVAEGEAQNDAFDTLEELAEQAAADAGEEDLANDDRALKLLDAAEFEGGRITALKPWVVDAARAHDPRLPRAADLRPLDLADTPDATSRLGIWLYDTEGEPGVAGWFIDAARARLSDARLAPGDEALLQRVRVEPKAPDWVARLAVVEGESG